jgi:hypothetical protein
MRALAAPATPTPARISRHFELVESRVPVLCIKLVHIPLVPLLLASAKTHLDLKRF